MDNKLLIKNKNNNEFLVKVVFEGDKYGKNKCLTHDKSEPLVEFYDYENSTNRIKDPFWGEEGQFVARYNLSTLLSDNFKKDDNYGINLDSGIPKWSIDSKTMKPVIEWLEEISNNIEYEETFKY